MISIIYAVAIYYFLKVRDQQAVRYWSFGSLIWGCAILLTIWRQELPLLLSYFIANGVAFVAYVVLNRALKCLIEEVQESFKLGLIDLGIFAVFTCVLYAIDLGMPGEFRELAKTGFVSAMVVAVSIQGARYCYLISVRHGLANSVGQVFAPSLSSLLSSRNGCVDASMFGGKFSKRKFVSAVVAFNRIPIDVEFLGRIEVVPVLVSDVVMALLRKNIQLFGGCKSSCIRRGW